MSDRQRILITGGLGEVGRSLAQYLSTYGQGTVIVTDTAPHAVVDGCLYETMDVTCPSDCEDIFLKYAPTIVYHLAAVCGRVISEIAKQRSLEVNVGGTYTIARLASKYKAKLVHISTSEVYGSGMATEGAQCFPDNWYGVTKLHGEQVARYMNPDATILRPFMIYDGGGKLGPNRSALVRFCENIALDKGIVVHSGSARSWLHLTDAARMIADSAHIAPGRTINIGNTEEPWPILELAIFIGDTLGKKPLVTSEPLPQGITGSKRPDLARMLLYFGEPKMPMARGIAQAARTIAWRVAH